MVKVDVTATFQQAEMLVAEQKWYKIAPCIGAIFRHELALSSQCVWLQRQA